MEEEEEEQKQLFLEKKKKQERGKILMAVRTSLGSHHTRGLRPPKRKQHE